MTTIPTHPEVFEIGLDRLGDDDLHCLKVVDDQSFIGSVTISELDLINCG